MALSDAAQTGRHTALSRPVSARALPRSAGLVAIAVLTALFWVGALVALGNALDYAFSASTLAAMGLLIALFIAAVLGLVPAED